MPGDLSGDGCQFVALQVKAARIHTSVELTHDALRQGTETIRLAEIVKIYPRQTAARRPGKHARQSARTLGELVGVPRGRVGIGLKLTGGRTAQAWARRHQQLRAALTPLVQERLGPVDSDVADVNGDDAGPAR